MYRNISKTIRRNGRHLSLILSVIAKGYTLVNVIFLCKKFAKKSKILFFALSLWGIEWRLIWEKMNLNDFRIRLHHNKMWKRGLNTFWMHCINKYTTNTHTHQSIHTRTCIGCIIFPFGDIPECMHDSLWPPVNTLCVANSLQVHCQCVCEHMQWHILARTQ